jgi:pyridoxamine 5'-phosphate oxidase
MDKPIRGIRREYVLAGLSEQAAGLDPLRLFDDWLDAAVRASVPEPNAMSLATVGPDGRPSVRIVLLKGAGPSGLVFYTNYRSRKGIELDANPAASACFWWGSLERQVRIDGDVRRVSAEESNDYFASRPRDSQLGAIVSPQSQPIASREFLEERLTHLEHESASQPVPRPEHWGGYRLVPRSFEFWQGRPKRLHDRLLYTRKPDGSWGRLRLAP